MNDGAILTEAELAMELEEYLLYLARLAVEDPELLEGLRGNCPHHWLNRCWLSGSTSRLERIEQVCQRCGTERTISVGGRAE